MTCFTNEPGEIAHSERVPQGFRASRFLKRRKTMDTNLKQFATRNDAPHHIRQAMIILLNQQLADTFDLYSQVKQAHWNVKGMHFLQLHLLFDELAKSLIEYVDLIAE